MKNLEKLKAINIFLILLLLVSCQKEIPTSLNILTKLKLKESKSHFKKIYLATTGNFNSNLTHFTDLTIKPVSLRIGGAKTFKSYLDILRLEIGDNLLLLDTGYIVNQEKKANKDSELIKFYEQLNYDAILLTENELLHLDHEDEFQLPFVSSNILHLSSNKTISQLNSKPYRIKVVNGVRIAIVGITTFKNDSLVGINVSGHLFDDPVASLISIRNELKSKSDLIIALIHNKTSCSTKFTDASIKRDCSISGIALKRLIKRFPPGLVDLVIGGEENSSITMIKGIPVIQSYGHGQFLGLTEFFYDTQKKKLVTEEIKFTAIQLCSMFFKVTNDCNTSNQDTNRLWKIKESKFSLIPAKFLGSEIKL